MAQHNNANHNNNINNSVSQQLLQQQQQQQQQELVKVKPVLHDFLGRKQNSITDSNVIFAPKTIRVSRTSDPDPSSTTDIYSERQEGNHLEGVPFYGQRSDFSGSEIGNRLVGNKRSVSGSTFFDSSRDAFQMGHDSLQNSHLTKILRNASGGELLRRPNDDKVFLRTQSLKSSSSSQIFHRSPGTKIDANKWERSILTNVGSSMQHQPHGGRAPFVYHITSNKMRDTNAGPSFISQSAADEGSRTGIKGAGILSSIHTANAATEKTSSAVLLASSRIKPVNNITDPESSTPPSRHGLTPASCQMTIFYGGQAHVFNNVQPNKADVIMGLAGSNGGSWSTTFSCKSAIELVHQSNLLVGENETAIASNAALQQDLHGRLSITGSSSHAIGPSDQLTTLAEAHQGSVVAEDTSNPVQASNPSFEDKKA